MLLWTISSLVSQLGLIMKYLINNSQNIFKHSFNLKVVHKHQLYNEHCNIKFIKFSQILEWPEGKSSLSWKEIGRQIGKRKEWDWNEREGEIIWNWIKGPKWKCGFLSKHKLYITFEICKKLYLTRQSHTALILSTHMFNLFNRNLRTFLSWLNMAILPRDLVAVSLWNWSTFLKLLHSTWLGSSRLLST